MAFVQYHIADDLWSHFRMKLESKDIASYPVSLVGANGAGCQQYGSLRKIKCLAMPVKYAELPREAGKKGIPDGSLGQLNGHKPDLLLFVVENPCVQDIC